MKRDFSSFGAPDQPEDPGEMTQREIDDERREILESDKFGEMFLEYIVDNLTPVQAGIIGRLLDSGRTEVAGGYVNSVLNSGIEKTFRWIQEAK